MSTAVAVTPTTTALQDKLWQDIRNNGEWEYRRFSGNDTGGSIYPSHGLIRIDESNVHRLVHGLNESIETFSVSDVNEYRHIIADTIYSVNEPVLKAYIQMIVLQPYNAGDLVADDFVMDVTILQRVRVYRDTQTSAIDTPDVAN